MNNPNPQSQALVTMDSKPGQLAKVLGMPLEYVQLVKDVTAKGATDEEFCLFLQIVHDTGLNPLTHEIWFYKLWNSELKRELPVIHASINGLRKAAEKIGGYCPGRPTEFEYDEKGNLLSATAYVKRKIEGEWHEIGFTAEWAEFARYNSSNKLIGKWATMPKHMLAKCAETHALKRAFPRLETIGETDSVLAAQETYAVAFAGPEEGTTPEIARQREIVMQDLMVMAEILLPKEDQDKLAAWTETAPLQSLIDKLHNAQARLVEYGRGIYEAMDEEGRKEALDAVEAESFDALGFEALVRFTKAHAPKPEHVPL